VFYPWLRLHISNKKCLLSSHVHMNSLDKTRYFTRTDSKQVVENKTSGSFTPVTDSISLVLNSDSGSSSAYNQLKLNTIKKMQRVKACLINHLELELSFRFPCTYAFVSGDRNVLLTCLVILLTCMPWTRIELLFKLPSCVSLSWTGGRVFSISPS
jgi:hypothetical protein